MWASLRRSLTPSGTTPSTSSYELLPTDAPVSAPSPPHRVPSITVRESTTADSHCHVFLGSRPTATDFHLEDVDEHPPPSVIQLTTLRRIPGRVPMAAYTLALVELAERASYYGVGGLFTNFIQRPLPPGSTTGAPTAEEGGTPGALGLGLRTAAALGTLFTLLAFATPLLGGALADLRWGKLPTIAVGTAVAGAAHVLSVYAALPSVLAGNAFPPFLAALLLLGGSAGLIKANIAPLMAEQYVAEDYVSELASGEKVIVEREATIQKIMGAYYHSINIGAFVAITSTFAEKYVGFWLAFLIPGAIFFLMPPVLWAVYPHLQPSVPPSSTAVLDLWHFARQTMSSSKRGSIVDRESSNVLEIGKLFLFFTIYNIADGGLNPLMTSLAGSMTAHGVPNDFLEKANPFAIVVSIPIFERFVYPYLHARRIAFGPIRRIVTGFLLAAAGMLWLAILQYRVYQTSPCGYEATACETPSPLSAWLVLPTPLLTGVSEALAVVSAMELGYTMSPPGLRSIITAAFLFMQATGAAAVLVLLPLTHDPALVWPFLLSALSTVGAAVAMWRLFKHIDAQ